jgi:hypothetical protein
MQHAAGGVFGLIAGMFVETILFITRTSMADKRAERKAKAELIVQQNLQFPFPRYKPRILFLYLRSRQSRKYHSEYESVVDLCSVQGNLVGGIAYVDSYITEEQNPYVVYWKECCTMYRSRTPMQVLPTSHQSS